MKCNFALLFIVLIAAGCHGSRAASTTKDAWFAAVPATLPEPWDSSQWTPVDTKRVEVIPLDKLAVAEPLLAETAWHLLTPEEQDSLTGSRGTMPGFRPYLVRGVYLNQGTGAYRVYICQEYVQVHHGSLGHSAVPMGRQALIVWLAADPKGVYSMCEMAE